MAKSNIQILKELNNLLLILVNILKKESEQNWIRAIDKMLKKVESALSGDCDPEQAINYVYSTYKVINSGNGSFSDFYIWRDNFADRKKENEQLEKVKHSILDLLSRK